MMRSIMVWCMLVCLACGTMAQRLRWLGTQGGDKSAATAVSADGAVVVGEAKKLFLSWVGAA